MIVGDNNDVMENEEVGEVGFEADEAEAGNKLEAVVRGESPFARVDVKKSAAQQKRVFIRILKSIISAWIGKNGGRKEQDNVSGADVDNVMPSA